MILARNVFGWGPRGIVRWLRTWSFFATFAVERTREWSALLGPNGYPYRLYEKRLKIGPLVFVTGAFAVVAYAASVDREDERFHNAIVLDARIPIRVRKPCR